MCLKVELSFSPIENDSVMRYHNFHFILLYNHLTCMHYDPLSSVSLLLLLLLLLFQFSSSSSFSSFSSSVLLLYNDTNKICQFISYLTNTTVNVSIYVLLWLFSCATCRVYTKFFHTKAKSFLQLNLTLRWTKTMKCVWVITETKDPLGDF